MDSEFHLNQDVLFEILSRTTLETLDTSKVVSKTLKELVEDSWFIKKYTQRTENIVGYFVQNRAQNSCVSTFVSIDPTMRIPGISMECFGDDMNILASSKQGILCCRKYKDTYPYYVCKPCTGQSVELPSPKGQDTFGERIALMILESNPFHYKIIRFSRARRHWPPRKSSFMCEIFDSKIWAWRRSKNLVMEKCTDFGYQQSVCIGGVAYWLTNHDTVLAFDSKTETHLEIPTPIFAFEDKRGYMNDRVVEYKGNVGFVCKYKQDKVLLWVVEDRRNYKWEIKKVVEIDKKKNRLIGCGLADMALMIGYSDQVYEQSGFYYPRQIFPFRSDWEPVDLENGCILSGLEEMMIN